MAKRRRRKKKSRFLARLVALVALVVLGLGGWLVYALSPTPEGKEYFVRYNSSVQVAEAVTALEEKGVVRNAKLLELVAEVKGMRTIEPGTYKFKPGMSWRQALDALQKPIRQQIMIPSGWWAARVGKRLEEKGVCTAKEYVEATREVQQFRSDVTFALPAKDLEGYLFPDTYDLPPLLGADEVVRRQLRAFEEKVVKPLGELGLARAVVVASMVELEAAKDVERPIIAGVIENRLVKRQKLEMDATVLFALQEWKVLGPGVVHTVKSPYNTYLNSGLPPGPIGSPGKASIEAALRPAKHGYFYYVAKPDRTHIFSETYEQHRVAIKEARKLWAAAKAKQ